MSLEFMYKGLTGLARHTDKVYNIVLLYVQPLVSFFSYCLDTEGPPPPFLDLKQAVCIDMSN